MSYSTNINQAGDVIDPEYPFVMLLIANGKFTELFLRNEDELNVWKELMTKTCILTDFYDVYRVVKCIGKGAFAKVRFVFKNFFRFLWLKIRSQGKSSP